MIKQAYISGQAGKALYEKDGSFFIAGLEDFSDPAECRPGDLSLYIESGADFVPLKDKELDLDKIKASLEAKRNASRALTLAISGFNKELTDSTRSLCIEAAEELLQDEAVLFFVKSRLLARPLPESHDINGAVKVADFLPTPLMCSLYEEILDSQQFIKHLSAAWSKIAPEFFTLEPERQKVEKQLIDLGFFADMASFMAKGDFENLGSIVVTYGLKPEISKIPKGIQLINMFKREVLSKVDISGKNIPDEEKTLDDIEIIPEVKDPVLEFIKNFEDKKKGKKKVNSLEAKEKVDKQINAIELLLKDRKTHLAQKYIIDLIKYNLSHGKRKHAGMTLCSIAKTSMDNNQTEFAEKLIDYAYALNVEDVVIFTTKAQFLKKTGHYNRALVVYDEAILRFPDDEFSPTGRAELLKEMGQYEKALAAFDETIKQFPHNEVARNGRAELLKEMGQYEKALAAFNETIKQFPNDEVARTGRAELLKEMGQYEKALAAFDETIQRFPNNEVAPTGQISLLILLGRDAEVEAQLFEGVPASKHDWINYHISAMFYLKSGNVDEAIKRLQYGAEKCPAKKSKNYFINALAFARIKKKDFIEAEKTLKSSIGGLNTFQRQTCGLLLAHSLAEMGLKQEAISTVSKIKEIRNPRIISLKDHLIKRYNIDNKIRATPSKEEIQKLDDKIEEEELFLALAA